MIQNTLVITAEIRIHLAFNYNSRRLYTTHSLKLVNIYLHKDLAESWYQISQSTALMIQRKGLRSACRHDISLSGSYTKRKRKLWNSSHNIKE